MSDQIMIDVVQVLVIESSLFLLCRVLHLRSDTVSDTVPRISAYFLNIFPHIGRSAT